MMNGDFTGRVVFILNRLKRKTHLKYSKENVKIINAFNCNPMDIVTLIKRVNFMNNPKNREKLAIRNKANLEEVVAGKCGEQTGSLNPTWSSGSWDTLKGGQT